MIAGRKNNRHATIWFDKLIIDDKVYRYNDIIQDIVCIGRRQLSRQQRGEVRGPNVNNNVGKLNRLDNQHQVNCDVNPWVPAPANDWGAHSEVGVD